MGVRGVCFFCVAVLYTFTSRGWVIKSDKRLIHRDLIIPQMHFAGGPKKYGYVCLPQVMGGPRHKLFFVYGGVVTNEHTKSSRPRGVLDGVFRNPEKNRVFEQPKFSRPLAHVTFKICLCGLICRHAHGGFWGGFFLCSRPLAVSPDCTTRARSYIAKHAFLAMHVVICHVRAT